MDWAKIAQGRHQRGPLKIAFVYDKEVSTKTGRLLSRESSLKKHCKAQQVLAKEAGFEVELYVIELVRYYEDRGGCLASSLVFTENSKQFKDLAMSETDMDRYIRWLTKREEKCVNEGKKLLDALEDLSRDGILKENCAKVEKEKKEADDQFAKEYGNSGKRDEDSTSEVARFDARLKTKKMELDKAETLEKGEPSLICSQDLPKILAEQLSDSWSKTLWIRDIEDEITLAIHYPSDTDEMPRLGLGVGQVQQTLDADAEPEEPSKIRTRLEQQTLMKKLSIEDVIYPDVALLTSKGIEFEAACIALSAKKIPFHSVDGLPHFRMVSFELSKAQSSPIRVVLVAGASDQSPEKSAIFATSVLHALRPASVMMIGMCAGLPPLNLGDVAIILTSFPAFEGLVNSQGEFKSDGRRVSASTLATHTANSAISDMCPSLSRLVPHHVAKAKIVDGISGSVVVDDHAGVDLTKSRKIEAYEMEASAFLTAVEEYNSSMSTDSWKKCWSLGVYKGVSDLAGSEHRENATEKKDMQMKATMNAFKVALFGLISHAIGQLAPYQQSSTAARALVKVSEEAAFWNAVKTKNSDVCIEGLQTKPFESRWLRTGRTSFFNLAQRAVSNGKFTAQQIRERYEENDEEVPDFLNALLIPEQSDSLSREGGTFYLAPVKKDPTSNRKQKTLAKSKPESELRPDKKQKMNNSTQPLEG
jgi:nucleoside phosphorylase